MTLEMVKITSKTGVELATELINLILAEAVIWQNKSSALLITNVNEKRMEEL